MCVCLCVCMCVCMCVRDVCACVCVCVRVCVCVCVCLNCRQDTLIKQFIVYVHSPDQIHKVSEHFSKAIFEIYDIHECNTG